MLTPKGVSLIAELVAAAALVIALAGFAIRRSVPWLICSAMAFTVLIVAVLCIVDLST
jgi:hypothetical protein